MNTLLLSTWTCVILLCLFIYTKYRNTEIRPQVIMWFVLAGFISVAFAGGYNSLLGANTQFTFFSGTMMQRFISFLIGAGLGEEFWKMGAGLLILSVLLMFRQRLSPSDRIIAFLTVGLTFAALENLWVYANLTDSTGMIRRGYLAVPLHGCMGIIHGVAVNRAMSSGRAFPLVVGYFASVFCHTLYDTIDLVINHLLNEIGIYRVFPSFEYPAELTLGPIVLAIIAWSFWRWRRVPEVEERVVSSE